MVVGILWYTLAAAKAGRERAAIHEIFIIAAGYSELSCDDCGLMLGVLNETTCELNNERKRRESEAINKNWVGLMTSSDQASG